MGVDDKRQFRRWNRIGVFCFSPIRCDFPRRRRRASPVNFPVGQRESIIGAIPCRRRCRLRTVRPSSVRVGYVRRGVSRSRSTVRRPLRRRRIITRGVSVGLSIRGRVAGRLINPRPAAASGREVYLLLAPVNME